MSVHSGAASLTNKYNFDVIQNNLTIRNSEFMENEIRGGTESSLSGVIS